MGGVPAAHHEPRSHRADLALLRDGYVHQFMGRDRADPIVAQLRGLGYDTIVADVATATRDADLHRTLASSFGFPRHYGHNLDALADCLAERATGARGIGLIAVFKGFGAFAARRPHTAQAVLDICADTGHYAGVLSKRFLCFAETDDNTIEFAPVGARAVARHE